MSVFHGRLMSPLLVVVATVAFAWSTVGFEMPVRALQVVETLQAGPQDPKPATFSFIVYGDIQGNYRSGHNKLVGRMLAESAGFVFNTGDISEDDGGHYADAFYPVIEPLVAEKFYFPSPGNHDVLFQSPKSRSPYRLFFGNVLEQLSRLPDNGHLRGHENQRLWYAVKHGPALFVVLDSNWFIDEGRYSKTKTLPEYAGYADAQFRWLAATLKASQAYPYKFVFFHHSPIISKEEPGFMGSGGHPGHSRMLVTLKGPDGEYLLDLFRRYRVTCVFTGHEHYYERWSERIVEGGGRPIHQINWVVNGLGGVKPRGAPEYEPSEIRKVLGKQYLRDYVERVDGIEAGWRAELEHCYPSGPADATDFHNYALVQVTPEAVTLQIKDAEGNVRDSAVLTLPPAGALLNAVAAR